MGKLARGLGVPAQRRCRGSMSTDEQQRRGGFVPIGELAGTLPGLVPRELAMTTQTRHHFTTLQQVNQLVEASEADADLGFMARLLALCSLPRTNPKQRMQYVRRNGPYALVMIAGGLNKLPYGKTAVGPGVDVPRFEQVWGPYGGRFSHSRRRMSCF